ncbi:thioredoxin domain-containing protein 16-like isoform X3 [Dreissena polymorpha]|uniref:thioredoxin domain-containing protein 16-like isoform X2 n=1 Tax=Dreissena polymorpha TaxID=45954 RepID=UPI0022648368|nr:thioredoxin domain-containing protein 16-like isoform X2 [Dreissena polymorpha]XP_052273045.1 thioredoxin domain-containing protein 16-like isoform X3 [Dreissena polymorpha]
MRKTMLEQRAFWLLLLMVPSVCSLDVQTDKFEPLKGNQQLEKFIADNHVRMVYFYKTDVKYLKFFFMELNKAADYLDLYKVKIGLCNCTDEENKGVPDCNKPGTENSVQTYRNGNPLLALELETMFDVNSILSNILQLVLLREVPILQSKEEMQTQLAHFRGKQDVVVGYMKAIGTFEHRVFMEVAYAYSDKVKFIVSTDRKATKLFDQPPGSHGDKMSIWWVWTQLMGTKDTHYHSIRFKGEHSLTGVAKFAKLVTYKKVSDIPADGMDPYGDLDIGLVRFYYDISSRQAMYQLAHTICKFFCGSMGHILINMDTEEGRTAGNYYGPLPAVSYQKSKETDRSFMGGDIKTDNVASFLDGFIDGEPLYPDRSEFQSIMAENMEEVKGGEEHEVSDEILDTDYENVEKQDDKIANAVEKTRKIPMVLGLVPALTDKTFTTVVQGANIAVVLFYFPFDAVSNANLRMFGEATDRVGQQTALKFARVNCYDWTDVCARADITIYPTLRVYRKDQSSWDYHGPQDAQAMFATMKLLELTTPVYVDNVNKAMEFIADKGSKKVCPMGEVTNITVFGLFRKEDTKEMAVFKQMSEESRERILFAYTDIPQSASIAAQLKVKLPAVVLSKFEDDLQPTSMYEGSFNLNELKIFVQDNKLPKLGVLTPLMFPEIRGKFSSMVVLFTDETDRCQQPMDSVREVVKGEHFSNVSFNMMQVHDNTSAGYQVLSKYTVEPAVPHIALVNFQKGEVFNYISETFLTSDLTNWLKNVLGGKVEPSSMLTKGNWKPVNKGYDFLKFIDLAKKKKKMLEDKKKPMPADKMNEVPAPDMFEEKLKERPMEDSEDSDTRRDLFDLQNSRLYHQAPGRTTHKHEERGPKGKPPGVDENNNEIKKQPPKDAHDEL